MGGREKKPLRLITSYAICASSGELFEIAVDARKRSKRKIIVHIFPGRMDDRGMSTLHNFADQDRDLLQFWRRLRPAYQAFEESRRIPRIKVSPRGDYLVQPARPLEKMRNTTAR